MSNARVRSYRDLHVWQRAKAFAVEIYRVTEPFPRKEQYGLTDQIRRAAVSIPSNIAEGHIKRSRIRCLLTTSTSPLGRRRNLTPNWRLH